MKALWRTEGGKRCALSQVYYSLSQRGIECPGSASNGCR
jgi:hypothetical protein